MSALNQAYRAELEQLRDKYGYTPRSDMALWQAGARVPAVVIKRMRKLITLCQRCNGLPDPRQVDLHLATPSRERYRTRYASTPFCHVGVLKFRNHDSPITQIYGDYVV